MCKNLPAVNANHPSFVVLDTLLRHALSPAYSLQASHGDDGKTRAMQGSLAHKEKARFPINGIDEPVGPKTKSILATTCDPLKVEKEIRELTYGHWIEQSTFL